MKKLRYIWQQSVGYIKKHFVLCIPLFFIIIGFLIYSNTFKSPFTFDDYKVILDKNDIKMNSIFTRFNESRYFGLISLAINYKCNKLNQFGYHLVNILIHIINTILVYVLVKKILTIANNQLEERLKQGITIIVSLIFLVHPIQTQAVNYICQRFTSLAALFSIVSILFYLKFRSSDKNRQLLLIASLIACLLAFKTKENTATLPLIVAAIDILFFTDLKYTKERLLIFLPYFAMMVIILLSFININESVEDIFSDMKAASHVTVALSRTQYFLTEQRVIVKYIGLLLFPANQSIDYYYPFSKSLFEPKTFLASILVFVLIVCSIMISKKYPVISFGMLWFFIFLIVESSIIPITDPIFEHRIYLPSIGFITALVYSVFMLAIRIRRKNIALIIFTIIVIILSFSTYERNKTWKDESTLWQDAYTKFPLNERARTNLGAAYTREKKCDEAIRLLGPVIKKYGGNKRDHFNIASCYWMSGRIDDAMREFNIVLKMAPDHLKTYLNLAKMHINNHDLSSAYYMLIKAQKLDPANPETNALFADVYCQTGNFNKALNYFHKAEIANLDNSNAYLNFGLCLLDYGKIEESRMIFYRCLDFRDQEIECYYYIAFTYDKENNYSKAAFYYKLFIAKSQKENPMVIISKKRLKKIEGGDAYDFIKK